MHMCINLFSVYCACMYVHLYFNVYVCMHAYIHIYFSMYVIIIIMVISKCYFSGELIALS